MRIVFMGTPEFAVPSLRACLEIGEVVAVVTQPDKPKGRGQAVALSPVKSLAQARGLCVLQPPKLRGTGFGEELRALEADVFVVTAYGKILPKDVLEAPRRGCVNVHASLLPRWRGAAPIQWALLAGDERSGVCLMEMEEGLDTGPVFARAEIPIAKDETSTSLHHRLSQLGGELLGGHLAPWVRGERPAASQPTQGATYAKMIEKEDGRLDFARPAKELERRVRALNPWPGTFTFLGTALLKVHRAKLGTGAGAPGQLLSAGPPGVEVACAQGSLVIEELQLEGKRRMSAAQFLAGHRLEPGSRPFGAGPR
jgi:methionyl-tRNA formyltransferase